MHQPTMFGWYTQPCTLAVQPRGHPGSQSKRGPVTDHHTPSHDTTTRAGSNTVTPTDDGRVIQPAPDTRRIRPHAPPNDGHVAQPTMPRCSATARSPRVTVQSGTGHRPTTSPTNHVTVTHPTMTPRPVQFYDLFNNKATSWPPNRIGRLEFQVRSSVVRPTNEEAMIAVYPILFSI
jgi:hypothetical protein